MKNKLKNLLGTFKPHEKIPNTHAGLLKANHIDFETHTLRVDMTTPLWCLLIEITGNGQCTLVKKRSWGKTNR